LKGFIITTIQGFLNENVQNNDKLIYDLVSDWIISSLDDTEKRQEIGEKLLNLNIPEEYREIPNNVLYRVGKPENKFISYSYDYRGVNKMISWYKKIFNRSVTSEDIIEVDVVDVNVLICIPTFLRKTGFSSGKRFDALWKSEYEVIVVNG
jgi:exoribonuclease II